jgi:hypothetical protein
MGPAPPRRGPSHFRSLALSCPRKSDTQLRPDPIADGRPSSLAPGRPARMGRQQRAYCRKLRERAPFGLSSLKPFLLLGETGPRLCFREQDAFQLGRRRFLGKLGTPLGMLVEFFGAHATLPNEPSLRAGWRDSAEFDRALGAAPVLRARYPHAREVRQWCTCFGSCSALGKSRGALVT